MQVDALMLAQIFRRDCTSCGADSLRWHAGREFARTPAGRALLADVVANSGGQLAMRDCLNGQVWVCRACGEVGVFL